MYAHPRREKLAKDRGSEGFSTVRDRTGSTLPPMVIDTGMRIETSGAFVHGVRGDVTQLEALNQNISDAPTIRWRGLEFDLPNQDVYPPKKASLLLASVATSRVQPSDRVLDLCTGSGVIAIAVARIAGVASVHAGDINPHAVASASLNASRNGASIVALVGDLDGPFEPGLYDFVTVHPPAVPYPAPGSWGLSWGMEIATNGGIDGTDVAIRSVLAAKRSLREGGRLLLLLPRWCHFERVLDVLRGNFRDITESAVQPIDFFPATEGRPENDAMGHMQRLVDARAIRLEENNGTLFSYASVIEAYK